MKYFIFLRRGQNQQTCTGFFGYIEENFFDQPVRYKSCELMYFNAVTGSISAFNIHKGNFSYTEFISVDDSKSPTAKYHWEEVRKISTYNKLY